jgi:ADP-heptose:LPS heptosyltransferase
LITLFRDLQPLKIDAFADLHNVLRSKIITFLFAFIGTKTATLNKGRSEKKALTRPNNKIFKQLPTMFQRHCEVFKKLGFDINMSNQKFTEKAFLESKIKDLINNNNQKLIGIAPFAQYDSKVYPIDLMQEVIDQLALNQENKILLFGGGKKEIEKLNVLTANKKNIINCAGKLTFEQELKLISNLDIMLSMDSGNAHLAAMFGVKVVTIWGATHPFAGFTPFNQPIENRLIANRELYPKLPTSVFGNKVVIGYQEAMRTILPETIANKISSLLV